MKYRDENGIFQDLYLPPTGDTLPIGAEVDYDGEEVPYGWEEVSEKSKILWTNPNPTSNFVGQNITLNSSDYDELEFYFKSGPNTDTLFTAKALKGFNTIVDHIINLNAGVGQVTGVRQRQINYVDNTTYNITDALVRDGGGTSIPIVENQRLIPIYVVGYKTGLFEEGE